MPVDSALLDRLEAALARATAGPWTLCDFGGPVVCDCAADDKWDDSGIAMPVSAASDVPLHSAADAQLIVMLRNHAAELIAAARAGLGKRNR